MQSNEKRYITALRRESGLFSPQNFNVNFATADKKATERTQNNVKRTNKRKLSAQDKARRTSEMFAAQLKREKLVVKIERRESECENREKRNDKQKQRMRERFK